MLIEDKEGVIFISSSGKIIHRLKTHGNPNDTFYMPKTSSKATKTNTTFTEKPYLLKPTQLYMPHITELDLSEENKENIPPFMLHNNLNNLVDYFDDYKSYSTYFHQQLPEWINKTAFKLSNTYYCQHQFLLQQKKNYNSLLLHTQRMLDSTNSMN